ncbi:MAG: flavodoxin domain-containing protein [Actinomycetota bacterium]|jgi:NAD(P)H dehydrogenase (quinone)|nr:flavodoxin domain-containing protein [Actinomycetota bacterium]MDD5600954.1 flavodoxin domain-containing protein [Actinomycetota bacterium]
MERALVVYYSRGGNTKKMAESIAEGIKEEKVEVEVRDVKDVKAEDLLGYDAIVIGSPTYYGGMAAEIKKLFDESVKFHGKLDGKVGAAFSSSGEIGGGNETTIHNILNAMLIHGMIIQGDWKGDHYGPVSINLPDSRVTKKCVRLGSRVANLVKKLNCC